MAQADVRLPDGQYTESAVDLRVKVMGGFVEINRTWYAGQWMLSPNWSALQFAYDNLDGSVSGILRNEAEYKKVSPGVFTQGKRNTIRATPTGYRWQDREGNWIDYDSTGKLVAYGDRNNVKVTLQYDAQGKRTGVLDHSGNQVLWYEYTGAQLTAIRDYANRRVQYQYSGNAISSVTDVLGNAWAYTYDSAGKLLTKTDPENRKITLTYYPNGRVQNIKDADNIGPAYVYDYDSAKHQYYIKETSPTGKVTERWYDSEGRTIRQDVNGKTVSTLTLDGRNQTIKDQRGLATANEYDEWDNLTKTTNPDGSAVTTQYEPVYSNVTQKTNQNGVTTKYEYDGNGNLTRLTEALGKLEQRITEYSYDAYGNRLTQKRLGDAVTQETQTDYTYDTYGNLKTVTDPESNKREYSYDAMGNALTLKDARGKLWSKAFDKAGHLKTSADPLGNTTSYAYDKTGNVIQTTDALNNVTQLTYNARGNLIKVTDALGGIVQYEYDAEGRRTKQIDQEGKVQQFVYNLDGLLTKTIDGNGNVVENVYGDTASGTDGLLVKVNYPTFSQEFKYDSRSNILQTIDVLDATTRYTASTSYDALGNAIASIDKENKTTQYVYDALNRLVKITDQATGITQLAYDNRDNLLSVKDPNGNITQYAFDRSNRQIQEKRPLGETTTYAYDGNGNLTQQTDAKGQVSKFSYDDAGRRTAEQYYANATATTPDKSITYNYNAIGSLTSYSDGTSAAGYNYDALQRKTAETVNYGSFSQSYTTTYYANGKKKTLSYPDGGAATYTYDANNQLASIQLPGGSITYNSYQWTAPTKITLPGGATRQTTYDPLLRVSNITAKDNAQSVLMNYQYGYDKADNILSKNTEHGNYSYNFDSLYRLTQASSPAPLTNEAYTYDNVGNRLTASNTTGAWNYNANNQLTAYGNVSLQYDANGSTAKKTEGSQGTQYGYDTSGRLAQVKDGTTSAIIAQYTYDPFGRRLSKEVSGTKTYFLYSDEGLLAEIDASGALQTAYNFAPDGTWGTNPIFMRTASGYYFYHNDHLGTPQKLTAVNGAVVWSARAQAFGKATVDPSSTVTNNLRFAGQYADQETGLSQNWFRDYEPDIGRYFTSDPIGVLKQTPNPLFAAYKMPLTNTNLMGGLNHLYLYTANPSIESDPRGLMGSRGYVNRNNYSPCTYYDQVCKKNGCRYHCNAANICRGGNLLVNIIMGICNTSDAEMNCIRSCLVEADKNARNSPSCKRSPAQSCTPNDDGCTKKSCINDYHRKCFAQCNVSPRCFGGNYGDYPNDGD